MVRLRFTRNSIMKKLAVFGGSGMLGSRLCKNALDRGWQVYSFSRSGRHALPAVKVHTIDFSLDANLDNEAKNDLKECTAIIHSMGTLFESGAYKKWIKPNESASSSHNYAQSFETLHRDSLKWILDFTAKNEMPNLKNISYISVAETLAPFPLQCALIDPRYFSTKREAEALLIQHTAPIQKLIFRPGFIYSDDASLTLPLSGLLSTMNTLKTQILPQSVSSVLPSPPERPINSNTLALSILDAIEGSLNNTDCTHQIVTVRDMLSNK